MSQFDGEDWDPFAGLDATPGNSPIAPKHQGKAGRSTEDRLGSLNRSMPFSTEAEQGVLSCVLQDPAERMDELVAEIPPEAFYHPCTRIVYELLLEFHQQGKAFDIVLLTHALRDKQLLEKVGGAAYISDLYTFTPVASNWPRYKALMRDKHLLRQTMATCAATLEQCQQHGLAAIDEPVGPIIANAGQALCDLAEQALHASGRISKVLSMPEAVDQWTAKIEKIADHKGKIRGLHTGWVDVDRDFGGLNIDPSGDTVIIAGFSGMGKSVAAVSIVENCGVHQQVPGAVFPFEMGVQAYMDRFVLGHAKVDTRKARTAFFSTADWKAIGTTTIQLSGLHEEGGLLVHKPMPIWMVDYSFIDCVTLRAEVQMLVRKHGIRWIVLDHFGQIKPSSKAGKADERKGQIEVMETLHQIRRELGITIFLMVQLTKAASDKTTRQPKTLSDLRGAGEIGEYCTHCVFIDRPPYRKPWRLLSDDQKNAFEERVNFYAQKNPDNWILKGNEKGQGWPELNYEQHAYFAIAKNRNGATPDNLCLRFQQTIQRFTNRTGGTYGNAEDAQQVSIDGF